MEKKLTSRKNYVIGLLLLGFFGSLTTFFLLQQGPEKENSSLTQKEPKRVVGSKKLTLTPKVKKTTNKASSKSLYVPPETFIGNQKLNFEFIKKEIKAQKKEKKTYDTKDFKRKEKDHKNVFLSLLKTK